MLNEDILNCLGGRLRRILGLWDWTDINEIRVRTGRAVILKSGGREMFVNLNGRPSADIREACKAEKGDVEEAVNMISGYSLYACAGQIREGFITVPGGHRAALAGTTVTEGDKISTIKNISSLSLRIASERKGCAEGLVRELFRGGLKSTLIVSPVGGGKTTMLRDVLRILSNGGYTVGISDERGEIAACYMGEPQLDIGERTDVLDCCPKAWGMSMLIRAMSPDIVAADEIGAREDISAMARAVLCGVTVICTAHGNNIESVKKRLDGADIFERYVLLKGMDSPGKIKAVYDGGGEIIWQSK